MARLYRTMLRDSLSLQTDGAARFLQQNFQQAIIIVYYFKQFWRPSYSNAAGRVLSEKPETLRIFDRTPDSMRVKPDLAEVENAHQNSERVSLRAISLICVNALACLFGNCNPDGADLRTQRHGDDLCPRTHSMQPFQCLFRNWRVS